MGIIPNENNKLGNLEKDPLKLRNHKLFEGMLVCHSLSLIDGEIIGDPLDIKVCNNPFTFHSNT